MPSRIPGKGKYNFIDLFAAKHNADYEPLESSWLAFEQEK